MLGYVVELSKAFDFTLLNSFKVCNAVWCDRRGSKRQSDCMDSFIGPGATVSVLMQKDTTVIGLGLRAWLHTAVPTKKLSSV